MLSSNNKINSIQLLRAVAVLLVVHCHILDMQQGNPLQRRFFYLQNFGAVGVDIFFVISGFIITVISRTYLPGKQGGYFFVKRMLRVVPLYWLVSFLITGYTYFRHGKLFAMASIIKTISFFPFFGKSATAFPVIYQGWTLSFELSFYSITAIALATGSKKYMLMIVLFFCCFIGLNYVFDNQVIFINFFGNGIMLEFLMGVLVGLLFLSDLRLKPFISNIVTLAGIGGLAASLVMGYGMISEATYTFYGSLSLARSVIWGIPSALLVAGLVMKEKWRPLHIHPFWIAIGNASFSVYLTHVFFIQPLYLRWQSWGLQGKIQPDIQIFISMAIAVAGGYLFYRLVELPLLRRLGSYINKPDKPVSSIYSS